MSRGERPNGSSSPHKTNNRSLRRPGVAARSRNIRRQPSRGTGATKRTPTTANHAIVSHKNSQLQTVMLVVTSRADRALSDRAVAVRHAEARATTIIEMTGVMTTTASSRVRTMTVIGTAAIDTTAIKTSVIGNPAIGAATIRTAALATTVIVTAAIEMTATVTIGIGARAKATQPPNVVIAMVTTAMTQRRASAAVVGAEAAAVPTTTVAMIAQSNRVKSRVTIPVKVVNSATKIYATKIYAVKIRAVKNSAAKTTTMATRLRVRARPVRASRARGQPKAAIASHATASATARRIPNDRRDVTTSATISATADATANVTARAASARVARLAAATSM